MLVLIGFVLLTVVSSTLAQDTQTQNELAATLEVLSAGVEMQRVNTVNWIPLRVEAVVGVGDTLRTDATGRARITFFADGTDTELLPNTEYRINAFSGDESAFRISAEVILGQTAQRLSRLLDANSSYDITTPAMSLVARGTQFAIRVEDGGRSAMLVQEGDVNADAAAVESSASVPPGFGVRTAVGEAVSDVVAARTFAELDAALDGCSVTLTTTDDVSLNVRDGASVDQPRIGFVEARAVTTTFGTTESGGWYRIRFGDGFGWVLSSSAEVVEDCAGLRVFPDNFSETPAEPSSDS
jgi:hypothetical protein